MKVYLSPSLQEANIGVEGYGTEQQRMNELCDALQTQLMQRGYTTYRSKPNMTLEQAVKDSNSLKVDMHIALHSNAAKGNAQGCTIFCHKYGGDGEKLARAIYKYLELLTPSPDREVREGINLYGIGKPLYETAFTTAPAVLIEVGFHDNKIDAKWIMTHIAFIADGIANGMDEYADRNTDYKTKYMTLLNTHYELLNTLASVCAKYKG